MPIPMLKRNVWYQISVTEGGGLIQTTSAMKTPAGVIVRHVTLVQGRSTTSESMVFVPDTGICISEANPGFYEITVNTLNEAIK